MSPVKITFLTLLSELMRPFFFFLRTHGCKALIIILPSHPQNKPFERRELEEARGPENKEAAVPAFLGGEMRTVSARRAPWTRYTVSLTKDHPRRDWSYFGVIYTQTAERKKKTKDRAYFFSLRPNRIRVPNASHLAEAGLTH